MGTWKEGFLGKSKKGDLGKSKLSGLGGYLPVYYAPRGKGFFLPWLTFHIWARKRGDFFFSLRACLEKKNCIFGFWTMFLYLGEGVRLGVGMYA